MKYFAATDSLYDITEKYPETLRVFLSHGFSQLADAGKRATFGKAIQLDIALQMKQIDTGLFVQALEEVIAGNSTSVHRERNDNQVFMKGLLPCPVRLPLQEAVDGFAAQKQAEGVDIHAKLKAASMGLDWIKEEVAEANTADMLDDLYLSAGFDMFFEDMYFGRFIKEGSFADPIRRRSINKDFDGTGITDPLGRYGIIAVVPAVFLVNTDLLDGRQIPQSWADLLNPEWERSVSLPVSDFDLFNAILLTIDKTYGRDAVAALGRNMLQSLHPAQMVKSDRLKMNKPTVTIMPNFFTKMAKEGGVMKAVWPSDGAIISPIFMIARNPAGTHLQQLAELLAGPDAATILAHQGLFPVLHPDVDNRLGSDKKFLWLGWDYIDSHNLNRRFAECHEVFEQSSVTLNITQP
jgi:ABC-type Fe3+ transport system substrate-binding protein